MISLKTRDFAEAVSLAALVPERRNTIPVLSTLRCRANGTFAVAGTDLDLTLEAAVPREAGDDADFVLADYQFVSKGVRASGDPATEIRTGADHLTIDAGALSIREKRVFHTDDWPSDCGVVGEEVFAASLSPAHLRQIERVTTAMSSEETRYYLNGVHIHHVDGWHYRAVATDGHRLIVVDLALPDAAGDFESMIIPRKTVRVLIRALGKSSDPIRMASGYGRRANREEGTAPERQGTVRVEFQGVSGSASVRLSSKTIDGTFPDYSRVIPKETSIQAVFSRGDLCRAVGAVSRPEGKVRAVKLAFEAGSVRVTSHFGETAVDAAMAVPCEHNAPAGFFIGFNGGYLLDMLGALTGDEVVIGLTDTAGPVLIKDPADTAFTGVLMPMRV